MSLHSEPIGEVPAEAMRVAQASVVQGSWVRAH